ncbi:MAG: hypothetical protein J4472_03355 [DPANN group archaeon]|nr:hypothetical protein [DPANN group archaeon]
MVSSYFTNPSQAGRDKTFQSDKYRTEIKPQEFGGDKFTLDTILEDGKLVTVVSVWKDTTGRRDYSLVHQLPFKFREGIRRPTNQTNDISRIEVTLRPKKSDPNICGVCQDKGNKYSNNRYMGLADLTAYYTRFVK